MSTSNGNGAWDHVSTSSLKQKQKEVFDRYALTGFRNKATTDARILMEFLLSDFAETTKRVLRNL